jgi:hypothetical protein
MKTYEDKLQIAESIIQEARSYVEHADDSEVVILDYYYDDLEKLDLKKEDRDLFRVRLDFILYSDQF